MKLLLIEDDEIQVRLYRRLLEDLFDDIEVDVCRAVIEALAAIDATASRAAPDLVLLDVRLPDGTGMEVLEHIRKRPDLVDVPVVVWSGSDLPSDADAAYRAGAAAYLVKPDGLDEFRTQVRDSIRFWRHVSRAVRGRPGPASLSTD